MNCWSNHPAARLDTTERVTSHKWTEISWQVVYVICWYQSFLLELWSHSSSFWNPSLPHYSLPCPDSKALHSAPYPCPQRLVPCPTLISPLWPALSTQALPYPRTFTPAISYLCPLHSHPANFHTWVHPSKCLHWPPNQDIVSSYLLFCICYLICKKWK